MPGPKDAKQQPARRVTKGCVLQREGTVQRRGEGGAGLLEDREGAWRSGPLRARAGSHKASVGRWPGGRAREAPWAGHGSGLLLFVVHLFPPFRVSQAHLTIGFRPSSATGRPWWKTGRQEEGTSRRVSPRPSQRSLAFHGGGGGVPWSLQLPTRRSRPPRSQPPAWRRGFWVSRLASLQPRGGSGSLLSVASHPLFMQQNPWMTIPCFEYLTLFH